MQTLLIDADGCPVKDEVYRVAQRFGFAVRVVANRPVDVADKTNKAGNRWWGRAAGFAVRQAVTT